MLTAVLLVRVFAVGMLSARNPGPPPWSRAVIDVNRARMPVLCTLPGIGPGRAEAIVLDRLRHGRFRSADELMRVPGIGPGSVARLRAHLAPLPDDR